MNLFKIESQILQVGIEALNLHEREIDEWGNDRETKFLKIYGKLKYENWISSTCVKSMSYKEKYKIVWNKFKVINYTPINSIL